MEETPSEGDTEEPSLDSSARTPTGTPVGVDDPYDHVDRCDHCTDDGRCRFAFERFEADPSFARERRDDDYRCPVARSAAGEDAADWEDWADCPNFASTTDGKECRRCGLEERRMAHSDERALIEEHHLSYAGASPGSGDDGSTGGDGAAGAGGGFASVASGAPDVGAAFDVGSGDDGPAFDDASGDTDGDTSGDEGDTSGNESDTEHEITVGLCRWCHAKVHKSWARIDDDVAPDPEAIAAREQRRGREFEEASFQSAAERFERE